MTATDPVGLAEVAERLGVVRATVDQWRIRNLLPPPRWTVGGRPAWDWLLDILPWAADTGRLRNVPHDHRHATTQYGEWPQVTGARSPQDEVADMLGPDGAGLDHETIVAAYRQAIADALPDGIILAGDVLYGPAAAGVSLDDIREKVAEVDLGEIIQQHPG